MSTKRNDDPESLAQCIAPLGADDRRALLKYWDRVTAEEWVPPSERIHRVPSLAELDERRARRRMRRQLASVTRLTRTEQVGQSAAGSDAA
ncbi:MAG: hypothetical protein ACR2G2_08660 [Pseudonocardia sp.]